MLHDNMDLCRLMVHAQQMEDSHRRKRDREGQKPRPSIQTGSSSGRSSFGVQDRPKFKKGHQRSGIPTPSKNSNAKVDKSYPKRGNDGNGQRNNKSCVKCVRLHGGQCLVGTNIFYGCGKSVHMVKDYPQVRNRTRQILSLVLILLLLAEPPKRNRYALKGREEQEK